MIFQEMSLVPTLDLTFPTRLTDHRWKHSSSEALANGISF
jgi:hypothetical protein